MMVNELKTPDPANPPAGISCKCWAAGRMVGSNMEYVQKGSENKPVDASKQKKQRY
jgi:hypothetical protein